jgi:hypothetical protein
VLALLLAVPKVRRTTGEQLTPVRQRHEYATTTAATAGQPRPQLGSSDGRVFVIEPRLYNSMTELNRHPSPPTYAETDEPETAARTKPTTAARM